MRPSDNINCRIICLQFQLLVVEDHQILIHSMGMLTVVECMRSKINKQTERTPKYQMTFHNLRSLTCDSVTGACVGASEKPCIFDEGRRNVHIQYR